METLTGLTVLVVDDDHDARELSTTILAMAGADVDFAGSAEEGLQKLATRRYDVLVSDIAMPTIDGISMLQALRRRGIRSSLAPALAFTAFATPDDREHALDGGFEEHLAKTADAATLVSVVGRLGRRNVGKPAAFVDAGPHHGQAE